MLARQWGLVCHSFRSKNKAPFACMTALTPEGERSDVIKSYDASVRLTLAPAQPCIHPDFPSIHPSSSHPRYPSRLIIIFPSPTVTLLVLFPSISRLQALDTSLHLSLSPTLQSLNHCCPLFSKSDFSTLIASPPRHNNSKLINHVNDTEPQELHPSRQAGARPEPKVAA